MRQKAVHAKSPSERLVKNIRRVTRNAIRPKRRSASCSTACAAKPASPSFAAARVGLYYAWSKEFLEAGKRRLAGDTARAATNGDVNDLRREAQEAQAGGG